MKDEIMNTFKCPKCSCEIEIVRTKKGYIKKLNKDGKFKRIKSIYKIREKV